MMRLVALSLFVSLMLVACGQDVTVEGRIARVDTTEPPATPARVSRVDVLRSEGMPSGFARAVAARTFEFPRDHGPHPEFRHEWWYVTGHLDARSGEHFGFELTFFRFALLPPSADAHAALPRAANEGSPQLVTQHDQSAWRTRQMYMAHFAVTDLDRGTFQASEQYARDALGLAGAQAEPFKVWLDAWSLGTPPNDTGSEGSSYWQLRASDAHYDFDLQLRPVTPPVLNGDAGLSRRSDEPGVATYYYSIPRLAAAGRIVRDGKAFDVQGLAWLDREWGSGALGPDLQGWDWFALQLDDGSTLMFYALRKQNGERARYSAGTWFAPDGTTHALANEDVQIDVKDYWDSPRGAHYPARWQLRVPALKLDVDIRPRLADQELALSTRYWEGAALISGTRAGNPIAGRAYVELVGYASRISK
jgi:predicted secreted hydrolase